MKETKTVDVYGDNDVNETIYRLGCFGWEAIGNQRYRKAGYSGEYYYTCNKITFSREMNSPWYQGVVELENYYYELQKTISEYRSKEPSSFFETRPSILFLVFGIGLAVFLVLMGLLSIIISRATGDSILLSVIMILIGIAIVIICVSRFIRQNIKYKKRKEQHDREVAEYNAVYPDKIKELENKQAILRSRAKKYIMWHS